jgi:hypothetical protein
LIVIRSSDFYPSSAPIRFELPFHEFLNLLHSLHSNFD